MAQQSRNWQARFRIKFIDRMGEIALNLMMNCAAKEDSFHDLELATFAVSQLAKMAKGFRTNYQLVR